VRCGEKIHCRRMLKNPARRLLKNVQIQGARNPEE